MYFTKFRKFILSVYPACPPLEGACRREVEVKFSAVIIARSLAPIFAKVSNYQGHEWKRPKPFY